MYRLPSSEIRSLIHALALSAGLMYGHQRQSIRFLVTFLSICFVYFILKFFRFYRWRKFLTESAAPNSIAFATSSPFIATLHLRLARGHARHVIALLWIRKTARGYTRFLSRWWGLVIHPSTFCDLSDKGTGSSAPKRKICGAFDASTPSLDRNRWKSKVE